MYNRFVVHLHPLSEIPVPVPGTYFVECVMRVTLFVCYVFLFLFLSLRRFELFFALRFGIETVVIEVLVGTVPVLCITVLWNLGSYTPPPVGVKFLARLTLRGGTT